MNQPVLACAGLLAVAACGGDDAVSYSAPVGIKLAFASNDVAAGRVGDDKNINTESGNPYAAYVAEARDVLGHDPARIELDSLTVAFATGTTGVTTFGEIYDGTAAITFVMNGTDTVVPVATLDVGPTTGAGPHAFAIGFDASTMVGADWASLLDGNFKVQLDGPAQGDFEGAGATIDLTATFAFVALD